MFNLQAFSSQKSLVADGNIANALNRLRSLLTKLLHSPETGVTYLTNNESSTISKGKIVSLDTSSYSCFRSLAANGGGQPEQCRGFAVALADVAPGAGGYFRFAGDVLVLLEPALVPSASDSVYVSLSVAGSGTNTIPVAADEWVRHVGIIKDASMYTLSPVNLFVKMIIETCHEYQIT